MLPSLNPKHPIPAHRAPLFFSVYLRVQLYEEKKKEKAVNNDPYSKYVYALHEGNIHQ